MKYLFVVQGEGRGHLTQAISLAEMLRRHGHEVINVLVGKSRGRELPAFFAEKIKAPITTFETPSFVFKKDKKHINLLMTVLYNVNPPKLRRYNRSIELINKEIKKNKPDVVINFYEMLTGMCHLRFRQEIPFISIGHQYLLRHPEYKYGKGDTQQLLLLRLHAILSSISTTKTLALSFYPLKDCLYERIAVVPPLLRHEVLELKPEEGDYILGYMLNQGYEEEVRNWHKKHPETPLHFFWDKKDAPKELKVDDTFTLHKIDDELFLHYMKNCRGYITTAGFESVCEALYLGKPIMMIPAHIEQEVNAADTVSTGEGIIGKSFDISALLSYIESRKPAENTFKAWVESAEEIFIKHLTTFV